MKSIKETIPPTGQPNRLVNGQASKRGRKKKPVKQKTTEEIIEYLAKRGANNKSIAYFLEMDENTLVRNYEIFLTKGRENLKMSIREKQIQVALKGNPLMLIWCGKQFADQKDKVDAEGVQVILSATHKKIE